MDSANLKVTFAEHLPPLRVAGLVSGIAAYGNVTDTDLPQTYEVTVFRIANLPQLKEQLTKWERHGFLQWHEAT